MIEEPYRWLEAIGNRREYVRDQLKGGSPAFGVKLPSGILMLGVGTGNSKVFEIFDRHALAGLGHPADIEKIRQSAIDAAHTEAFTRAPEDVSLRRLIGFGLSPQLKTNFEQIFSAPFLTEILFAELGTTAAQDVLLRLHFDGSFEFATGRVAVVSGNSEAELAATTWLEQAIEGKNGANEIVPVLLKAWTALLSGKEFSEAISISADESALKTQLEHRVVEIGFLNRSIPRAAKYESLSYGQLGL